MTTSEIVDFVEKFGSDEEAAAAALLEKLMAEEVTMEQLNKAIGEGSEAYPLEYPHKGMVTDPNTEIVTEDPSFLARLFVDFERAQGDSHAFAC